MGGDVLFFVASRDLWWGRACMLQNRACMLQNRAFMLQFWVVVAFVLQMWVVLFVLVLFWGYV